jgi:hypothetical protein
MDPGDAVGMGARAGGDKSLAGAAIIFGKFGVGMLCHCRQSYEAAGKEER